MNRKLNASQLVKELNKRGNLPHKILVADIRRLWESGWITADKESRNILGRTKYKLKDVHFESIERREKEILDFLEKMKDEK